jgi:hypothetical protein
MSRMTVRKEYMIGLKMEDISETHMFKSNTDMLQCFYNIFLGGFIPPVHIKILKGGFYDVCSIC